MTARGFVHWRAIELVLATAKAAGVDLAELLSGVNIDSVELSARCGVDVWLKFECFQSTGSFKLRGALNALQLLDDAARRRGVVTASADGTPIMTRPAANLWATPGRSAFMTTGKPSRAAAFAASSEESATSPGTSGMP